VLWPAHRKTVGALAINGRCQPRAPVGRAAADPTPLRDGESSPRRAGQSACGVAAGTYIHANKISVDQAAEAWLASEHSLKPSTLRGHRVKLAALRAELGHVEVQKLTKADLDGLIDPPRCGAVEGRKTWTPRSCNYLLYLTTAVLDDQMKHGNVARNVARLVDRVAGNRQKLRTLTDKQMSAILDHDSRDRHL
jgi:integrase